MFDPASAAPADAKISMSELMKLHSSIVSGIESAEANWLKASEALEQEQAA
jgi:ATP-binding cassette subfamily F protein 3